ncbi:hypothetical protein [Castellaniella sp.]|uniref:hypothetical protein n=1 Tax=Castellaniella sp. TaxID=1955812 RepID=UPI002AFEB0B0|nr:hypothetical protein [Castellaniella sp.]
MLVPFSNYPVNAAFERMMAEERVARAAQPQASLMARILNALLGRRDTAYA